MKPPLPLLSLTQLATRHSDAIAPSIRTALAASAALFPGNSSWDTLIQEISNSLQIILEGMPTTIRRLETANSWQSLYRNAVAHEKARSGGLRIKVGDARHPRHQLYSIFNFDEFSEATATWGARELCRSIGCCVCPYCNLDRISHFPISDGTTYRPDLDHFMPRAKHPWFGMSFFNLIPCCSICNSRIKKGKDFHPDTYSMPLVDDIDSVIEFITVVPASPDKSLHSHLSESQQTGNSRLSHISLGIRARGGSAIEADRATKLLDDMSVIPRYMNCAGEIAGLLRRLRDYRNPNLLEIARLIGVNTSDAMAMNSWKMAIIGSTGTDVDVHVRPLGKLFNDLVRIDNGSIP